MSADEPAPRRQRQAYQPFVAAPVGVFKDPPIDPPLIRPPGFLSRFRPAPPHTLGRLTGRYTACGALHFYPIDNVFKACYKKGDILLLQIYRPPPYLYYLFIGDDPLYRSF
jgi:hypothetical protein